MTIEELLAQSPEDLAKLSDAELAAKVANLFPAVRQPVMPEDGSTGGKLLPHEMLMKSILAKEAGNIEKYRAIREAAKNKKPI